MLPVGANRCSRFEQLCSWWHVGADAAQHAVTAAHVAAKHRHNELLSTHPSGEHGVVAEDAPRRRLARVLTALGWLVSTVAALSCAAVWWVCARLELLFTAAGVRELSGLGSGAARERLASVHLEALSPFVALYGWRYAAVAALLSVGFGVGFALLWLGRAR